MLSTQVEVNLVFLDSNAHFTMTCDRVPVAGDYWVNPLSRVPRFYRVQSVIWVEQKGLRMVPVVLLTKDTQADDQELGATIRIIERDLNRRQGI